MAEVPGSVECILPARNIQTSFQISPEQMEQAEPRKPWWQQPLLANLVSHEVLRDFW